MFRDVTSPLRSENILLRGATLKISPFIYGCALYTGKDTKLMLNSKFKPCKLSCVERFAYFLSFLFRLVNVECCSLISFLFYRTLNRFILLFLLLLFTLTFSCLIGSFFYCDMSKKHWYLRDLKSKYLSVIFIIVREPSTREISSFIIYLHFPFSAVFLFLQTHNFIFYFIELIFYLILFSNIM